MSRKDEIAALLSAAKVDTDAVAKLFEEAEAAERVVLTRSIDGKGQAHLWEAAAGRGVTIADMVPRDVGPLAPVTFHGKNSLPRFTHFEKRFCRPPEPGERDVLYGFNYQPTRWLAPITGPGYFVAYDSDYPLGGVAVDYREIPTDRPAGWPELHDNHYRLSRFIYEGMVDYLRRVSAHLLIGRATRGGKALPNYFLLCREDP